MLHLWEAAAIPSQVQEQEMSDHITCGHLTFHWVVHRDCQIYFIHSDCLSLAPLCSSTHSLEPLEVNAAGAAISDIN